MLITILKFRIELEKVVSIGKLNFQKRRKLLMNLARLEGFELPTTRFEASGSSPLFSTPVYRLLYIVVPK